MTSDHFTQLHNAIRSTTALASANEETWDMIIAESVENQSVFLDALKLQRKIIRAAKQWKASMDLANQTLSSTMSATTENK